MGFGIERIRDGSIVNSFTCPSLACDNFCLRRLALLPLIHDETVDNAVLVNVADVGDRFAADSFPGATLDTAEPKTRIEGLIANPILTRSGLSFQEVLSTVTGIRGVFAFSEVLIKRPEFIQIQLLIVEIAPFAYYRKL
jgi:hypothetical protein